MLRPKLSNAHRQEIARIRTKLSGAMQASTVNPASGAEPLRARRAELQARLQELECGASLERLESAATEINLLQTQVRILDGKLEEVQRAHEAERRKQESEAVSVSLEAITLLSEVALEFYGQHRDRLAGCLADYSGNDAGLPARLTGLMPFFNAYRRRIDSFRMQTQTTPDERLLAYLDAAMQGQDFLAPI